MNRAYLVFKAQDDGFEYAHVSAAPDTPPEQAQLIGVLNSNFRKHFPDLYSEWREYMGRAARAMMRYNHGPHCAVLVDVERPERRH